MGEGFHFLLHVAEVVEDLHALGEDGVAAESQAVLREVACGDAFHPGVGAVVQSFGAGEDAEERGFAGAVGSNQAYAVAGVDLPVR